MTKIIHEFIQNSLTYYFSKKNKLQNIFNIMEKFNKFENKNDLDYLIFEKKDTVFFSQQVKFIELDIKYDIEFFGLYSNKSKVFSWAWILPASLWGKTTISKKLFDYAYQKDVKSNINHNLNLFLKILFSNSRTNVNYEEQMELILAISHYLLKETDNFEIIIPVKKYLSENDDDFIIMYYILKNIIK